MREYFSQQVIQKTYCRGILLVIVNLTGPYVDYCTWYGNTALYTIPTRDNNHSVFGFSMQKHVLSVPEIHKSKLRTVREYFSQQVIKKTYCRGILIPLVVKLRRLLYGNTALFLFLGFPCTNMYSTVCTTDTFFLHPDVPAWYTCYTVSK